MLTLDSLKEFGVDADIGLARCAGKEDLYFRLIKTVPVDENYNKLIDAVNNKNYDEAFDLVHALKGVLMNLSITPLYDKISELTEYLRAREDRDYSEILKEIMDIRERLGDLCQD